MQRYTVYFIWKLLYMFRVVPSPIIRSANNCIYSIWSHRCSICRYRGRVWTSSNSSMIAADSNNGYGHNSLFNRTYCIFHRNTYTYIINNNCNFNLIFIYILSVNLAPSITVWQIPDAVDTVVCAPVDGWWYHPKHVEQFPDKINCVTLHLVRYILEYYYNARTHER